MKYGALRNNSTRAYRSWLSMRTRCNNPTSTSYERYGGRGIRICDRWNDFALFLADMGEPAPGLTIDRIDNDGNYEPGNCRWATALEQRRNTSYVKFTMEKAIEAARRVGSGETMRSVARDIGVHEGTISDIMRGKSWAGAVQPGGYPPPRPKRAPLPEIKIGQVWVEGDPRPGTLWKKVIGFDGDDGVILFTGARKTRAHRKRFTGTARGYRLVADV